MKHIERSSPQVDALGYSADMMYIDMGSKKQIQDVCMVEEKRDTQYNRQRRDTDEKHLAVANRRDPDKQHCATDSHPGSH